MPRGPTCAANAFLFPVGTERNGGKRRGRQKDDEYYDDNENSGCSYALVRTPVSFFLYRLLTQFLAFPRPFLSIVPLFCLVRAIPAAHDFASTSSSAASPLLLLLRPPGRFVLFSFCLLSRLRTSSLHSRARRVEGPRQGKPVSRVRVISLCRHARSSMTFRTRTPRECNTNDAPARSSDRRFSSSVLLNCISLRLTMSLTIAISKKKYFSVSISAS